MKVAQLRGIKFEKQYDAISKRSYWDPCDLDNLDKTSTDVAKFFGYDHFEDYLYDLRRYRKNILKRAKI